MRILAGTEDGLHKFRWIHGERSGRTTGVDFEGHAIRALALNGDVIHAAVHDVGLMCSTDGGETWDNLLSSLAGQEITALAVSPRDSRQIWIGTQPAALHASADGGKTWEEQQEFRILGVREGWKDSGQGMARVTTIACDPTDRSRLYAGVEIGGAYRSDDGGTSWRPINEGLFDEIHQLGVDPRTPNRIYASTGGGFHYTENRGNRWTRHESDLGSRYGTCLAIENPPNLNVTQLILASASGSEASWMGRKGNAEASLSLSLHQGETWIPIDIGGARIGSASITALATDPVKHEGGFIGTTSGGIWHIDTRLQRWSKIQYGLPPITSMIVR